MNRHSFVPPSHRNRWGAVTVVGAIAPVFLLAASVVAQSTIAAPTPESATKAPAELARGVVFEDVNGNGVLDNDDRRMSNVRVSNGSEIVLTDEDGVYQLPVTDDLTLFVIKPRGFKCPINDLQLPQFYYTHKPKGSPPSTYPGVSPTGPLPKSVNFPLYAHEESDEFTALLFGDPQPRDQREVDYIAHDVVEEITDADASFGVTLGDIVFDDLDMFRPQASVIALLGIPWYNVVGNHDLNFDAREDRHSDETFERHFGPSYYAFDHGPVHFLVLDDVEWFVEEQTGRGTYRGGFGTQQLAFVKRDLELIPQDQLVVLMMHIPLTDVGDRQTLYRLIEKRPFCISISAHTHTHEHRWITAVDGWQGPQPHHHIVNVTVSGSWWSGAPDERGIPHTQMRDGGPNGYSIIRFDGVRYDLTYRAAGRPRDYQMAIYVDDEITLADADGRDFYVNVFDGSSKSDVDYRIDGGAWSKMRYAREVDPQYRKTFEMEAELLDPLQQPEDDPATPWRKLHAPDTPSTHLWKARFAQPVGVGLHLIEVRATVTNGKFARGQRSFRVVE